MIDSAVMELDTQWFVIKFEGKEYMIDFGLEPYRNENCIATVRLQPDGQLKLIRFDNPRGRNFTPRMFKKSG